MALNLWIVNPGVYIFDIYPSLEGENNINHLRGGVLIIWKKGEESDFLTEYIVIYRCIALIICSASTTTSREIPKDKRTIANKVKYIAFWGS